MVPGFPAAALNSPDKDRPAEDNHTLETGYMDNHAQERKKHKVNHKLAKNQQNDNKNNHTQVWNHKNNKDNHILEIIHNDNKGIHVKDTNYNNSENSVNDIMHDTKQRHSQEYNQNMNHKNSQADKDKHTQDEDNKYIEEGNHKYGSNQEEKSKDRTKIQPLDKGRSIVGMFDEDFNESVSLYFPPINEISKGSDENNADPKPVETDKKSSEMNTWLIILLLVTLVILTLPILMFLIFCFLHATKLFKVKLRSQNQVTPINCEYDSGHSLSKVQI